MENISNKVNISMSISRTSLSNKSNRILKPTEIYICKDNSSLYVLSRHAESLSSVTPNQQSIPPRNKIKKTQTLRSLEKKLLKNQLTQGKGQNRIL